MKVEEDNKIPFLDVLITKKNGGVLGHQVYRKKTHTDRYLHADSHHLPTQKIGVLNTLLTRAIRISDDDHLNLEIDHLSNIFQVNGYSKYQIKKVIRKVRNRSPKKIRNIEGTMITLPYIKGTTDVTAKILRKKSIGVTFAPPNSIGRMLDTSKDPVEPLKQKGVYSVPCSCEIPYIGETGRSVQVRLKEHCADIMHDRHQKSALAEHTHHSRYHICIEETKLITREEHYKR